MDFGKIIGDSFEYTKEAVVGNWNKWLMLIIATILLALPLMGYAMKVLRGEKPAPEVVDWGTLFIDGIKAWIVSLIYAIPIIIVGFVVAGAFALALWSGNYYAMGAALGAMAIGALVIFVLGIIITVFWVIGIVRFARTGSIGEAFNISNILATINKIGWVPYIIALIILMIIAIIIQIIFMIIRLIPFLGIIICLCLIAPLALLFTRYICLLYDSAGAA
jgi:hypothetical protein